MTNGNNYKPEYDADNHIEDLEKVELNSEKEEYSPTGWRILQFCLYSTVIAYVITLL